MSDKMKISVYKKDSERDLSIILNKFKKPSINYHNIPLLTNEKDGFKLSLYYHSKISEPPYWKKFLKSTNLIDESKTRMLDEKKSNSESFIFILSKGADSYFITGGQGHNVIKDFIKEDFGMDILSRLITDQEHILKAVREKYIVGGMIGSSKFFRKNYNFIENESFGKIYNELKANLDKKILKKYFGFNEKDINCIATSSFSLNKSTNFEELFNIIKGCESIMELEPKIVFNSVVKVIKNKNKGLIKHLEDGIIEKIKKENHYLCHQDFEKYLLESNKYILDGNDYFNNLEFDELENIEDIFIRIENDGVDFENVFIKDILKLHLVTVDENGDILTEGKIFNHIIGEYQLSDVELNEINKFRSRNNEKLVDGKNYFLIDGNWYQIKDNFIEDLNHKSGNFIFNNFEFNILEKKWQSVKKRNTKGKEYDAFIENNFNESFIGSEGIIVLDKILADEIEICDILKYTDDKLYIIHVKKGFDQNIRDLSNQISISASRLTSDKNNGFKTVGGLYDDLVSKKQSTDKYFKKAGEQSNYFNTKDDFIKLFQNKEIIYVLAFMDLSNRDLYSSILGDINSKKLKISNFNSNIAKFSLNELSKTMKSNDCKLIITQIFNEIK